MRTQLRIGEIAQLLGITTKAIRHYSKIGLLKEPERTEAGYRLYNTHDLLRLQRIRRLQSFGLSLSQIKTVLGEPEYEHTLREILQSLDRELEAQIQALEQRRERIKTLLADETLDVLEQSSESSPTVAFVKEHLGDFSQVSPAFWEQEAKLYANIDNFHWPEEYQQFMEQAAQRTIQHYAAHPEEYQTLLILGERFATLPSLPEDAPEVEQLIVDFRAFFASHPFWLQLQVQLPQLETESPFAQVMSDLITPIYSPAQMRVLDEIRKLAEALDQKE